MRQGLRTLLESNPLFEVVGEAADGREALALVKRRKPDVLIADLMMPGVNGLQLTTNVSRLKVKTRVIVLSMYRDDAYVLEAFRNGAAGYVAKESRRRRALPGHRGNPRWSSLPEPGDLRDIQESLWDLWINARQASYEFA